MNWMKGALVASILALGSGSALANNPTQQQQQAPQSQSQPTYGDQSQYNSENTTGDEDTAVESFEWVEGQSHLGVVVMGLTRDLRRFFNVPNDRGVLVAHVMPRSAAARAGIRPGDVLVDINGQAVRSADDVLSALAQEPTGTRFPIDIVRDGQQLRVATSLMPQQRPQRDYDRNNQSSAL